LSKPFQRKPRSDRERNLLERTDRFLPAGPRNPAFSPAYAMVVREARGSKLTDCSGNEYIDYLLGSGPMLLGHAHPAVVAAVREALESGSNYLMVNEPSILLAEQIVEAVPCAEKVCFQSSGSEATFFALRLARAFRRRDTILKFEGAYHGQADYVLMSNQWTKAPADFPTPVPNSLGIPKAIESEVLIAPFNDIETTSALIEKHHDALAGVIVEPMQRTIPPRPGFLQALRELTAHYAIPLIFDEVVTGFRLGYGGAQTYYGVTPDLCALGKSISGGHPIAVLCGRAEIMEYAAAMRQLKGNYVSLTGTFSGNPISCIAALAVLAQLRKEGAYDALFARGRRLMDGLRKRLRDAGIPAQVIGEPPAFQPWFTPYEVTDFRSAQTADVARNIRFTQALLDRGVLKAHEKFFVSMAHSDADIECTLEAFDAAIASLSN